MVLVFSWASLHQTGKGTAIAAGTFNLCLCVSLYFIIFCNEHILLFACVYMDALDTHACQHTCGNQRTTLRGWFAPSALEVPGVELRLSVLAASTFTTEPSHQPTLCKSQSTCKPYLPKDQVTSRNAGSGSFWKITSPHGKYCGRVMLSFRHPCNMWLLVTYWDSREWTWLESIQSGLASNLDFKVCFKFSSKLWSWFFSHGSQD